MLRVALVAPATRWRDALAEVADSGALEPELTAAADADIRPDAGDAAAPEASSGTRPDRPMAPETQAAEAPGDDRSRPNARASACLLRRTPGATADIAPGGEHRPDLEGGERELERVSASAVTRGRVRALVGWAPAEAVAPLAARLAPWGASLVELASPPGVSPPTLLRHSRLEAARPLVDTFATVPYADVDPTWFAAASYVLMFGMMFGDVGDGLLLAGAALALRTTTRPALAGVRRVWRLVLALGLAAVVFGLLYGEAFGPTGLVPELWLSPLEEPVRLLAAGVAVGAALIAVAHGIGITNRWREGGWRAALYAPTGIAGTSVFAGAGLLAAGVLGDRAVLWASGAGLGVAGLALAGAGLKAEAGPGAAGAVQAGVELFDLVVRLGSNLVSFARLAAFGLTHAALGAVVWQASNALWAGGGAMRAAGALVFVAGHAVTFALEALVAAVQALRLEYYGLFSRVFVSEGRPFRPWHVPFAHASGAPGARAPFEEAPCPPGSPM